MAGPNTAISVRSSAGEVSGDGEAFALELPADTPAQLTVALEPGVTNAAAVTWKWAEEGKADAESSTFEVAAAEAGTTRTLAVGATIPATAELDAASKTAELTISVPTAKDPAAPASVIEAEVGEWDPKFARTTGIVLGLLALLVVGLLFWIVTFPNPSGKNGAPTYAEHLRAVVATMAFALGSLILLTGVFMAALEVRGRLRKVTLTKVEAPAAGRHAVGAEAALEAVPKILDAASKLRGTVAVLAVGTALILGSLWSVGQPPTAPPTNPPAAAGRGLGEVGPG